MLTLTQLKGSSELIELSASTQLCTTIAWEMFARPCKTTIIRFVIQFTPTFAHINIIITPPHLDEFQNPVEKFQAFVSSNQKGESILGNVGAGIIKKKMRAVEEYTKYKSQTGWIIFGIPCIRVSHGDTVAWQDLPREAACRRDFSSESCSESETSHSSCRHVRAPIISGPRIRPDPTAGRLIVSLWPSSRIIE